MKKSAFSLLAFGAVALASASGLASCGRGYSGSGPDYLPDMSIDTRGTTIEFWAGFGQTVSGFLEQVIEDFEEATGITVNYTPQSGYDNLATQINLSASSKTYPNVAVGYPDHMASYRDSDIIMRLDQFIEHDTDIPDTREGTATDPNAEGETFHELADFDYSDFYSDYTLENESLEYREDGTGYILGIPFNKSTEVMVYNATFFENPLIVEAGIHIPTTWDEVLEQGTAIINWIKNRNGFGKVITNLGNTYNSVTAVPATEKILLNLVSVTEDDFYPLSYDSQANFFITAVRQWGGEYTEVDPATMEGSVVFDNDATRSALTRLNELYEAHVLGIPASFEESSYCSAHYRVNESLMNVGSSAGVSNCATGQFTSKVAPIPFQDADNKYVISQGTNMIMLQANAATEEEVDKEFVASWKFIKYMTQIGNGKFAMLTGYFPTCGTSQNDEQYQEFLNNDGTGDTEAYRLQRYAAQVNNNTYMNDAENWKKFVDPGFSGSSVIRTRVDSITAEVFIGGSTAQEAIDSAYADLRDYHD